MEDAAQLVALAVAALVVQYIVIRLAVTEGILAADRKRDKHTGSGRREQ